MLSDDELLHRAIKPKAIFWNEKTNTITSALFKDSKGVSVDANANRDDDEIKNCFLAEFSDLKGEARVTVDTCKEKDCYVKADPLPNNNHHALIQRSENEIPLTKSQARYLAKKATTVIY